MDSAENMHLLPNFAMPEFEHDGIHLTTYSGLEFVLHLFDVVQELLEGPFVGVKGVASKNRESTHVLADHVVALAQDHCRLN